MNLEETQTSRGLTPVVVGLDRTTSPQGSAPQADIEAARTAAPDRQEEGGAPEAPPAQVDLFQQLTSHGEQLSQWLRSTVAVTALCFSTPLSSLSSALFGTTTQGPVQDGSQAATHEPQGGLGLPRRQENFSCPVCLDTKPSWSKCSLEACGREDHAVCKDCMRNYLEERINAGRVTELDCPVGAASQGGCSGDGTVAQVEERELRSIVGSSTLEKYSRFMAIKKDVGMRDCPKCSALVKAQVGADGKFLSLMVCTSCRAEFCYYHADAHKLVAGACEAYEAKLAKESRQHARKFDLRPCPVCGRETQKNGGCSHMQCCKCKTDWCWQCGRVRRMGNNIMLPVDPEVGQKLCICSQEQVVPALFAPGRRHYATRCARCMYTVLWSLGCLAITLLSLVACILIGGIGGLIGVFAMLYLMFDTFFCCHHQDGARQSGTVKCCCWLASAFWRVIRA